MLKLCSLSLLVQKYEKMLTAVMAHRPVVIAFAIIVFASLPILFKFIPSELAPSEDKGVVVLMGTAPSNANLDYIQNTMALVVSRKASLLIKRTKRTNR